ncbi:MAG: DUF4118 domain-containing protein, partial [Humidesulfovibrio sp.]|nr:DUF4118 domain-containing protein [Humidesulfovibrio sp.]
MDEFCRKHPHLCAHLGAALLVGAAFAGRAWLLGGFDPAIPYLTFYPAVMLASLLGGLAPGLLATALSSLLAAYFFIEPIGNLQIQNARDLLGLLAFIAGSTFASAVGELHLRHRAKLRKIVEELAQANTLLVSEIA